MTKQDLTNTFDMQTIVATPQVTLVIMKLVGSDFKFFQVGVRVLRKFMITNRILQIENDKS